MSSLHEEHIDVILEVLPKDNAPLVLVIDSIFKNTPTLELEALVHCA